MPRKGITAYDLLISCPGDVMSYLEVIRDSVDSFNRYFGTVNNIEIVTKHWSTDSYPQSGDKPQELLNKQFVQDCDAAIALFWTRFGTPTDKFGSGTEEEIEEMLIAGKQVFMYFVDEPINPSQVDMEQYNKVLDFRNRYKDIGIYAFIKNKDDFRREFTNHLAMHFIPLITGTTNAITNDRTPKILIKGISDNTSDVVNVYNTHLKDSKLIEDKKEKIIQKILNLNSNNILPERVVAIKTPSEPEKIQGNEIISKLDLSKIIGNSAFMGTLADVDFDAKKISVIDKFVKKEGIILSPEFWSVGNLKKRVATLVLPYSSGTSYEGTEDEKKRYELLNELYWDVVEFNEFIEYFSYIDAYSFIKMSVENVGNSFDEDIDVKLFIKKGVVVKKDMIKYPEINIIEEILEIDFIDFVFSISENDAVESYAYYPVATPVYENMIPMNPFNGRSASEEYEIDKEKFDKSLEQIYCYKLFENDDEDILMFHMDYLKHNKAMTFPAALMLQGVPETIKYEITSKFIADVVKSEIKIGSKK